MTVYNEPVKKKTPNPISVKQLLDKVNYAFHEDFSGIYMKAEITSLSKRNGAYYITLKDTDPNIDAKIESVMFTYRIDESTRNELNKLEVGKCIKVFGVLEIYVPYGKLTLKINRLKIIDDLGENLLRIERYKQYLIENGFNDISRKKTIPLYPKTVAIITSEKGDAYQDMLNTIKSRAPDLKIYLFDTLVQGEKAKYDISYNINLANTFDNIEVIIIGRGGGAVEDLLCFSEPEVIEAIINSKIPIISAVGHQTDNPVSDLVADYSAITPTAAAIYITQLRVDLKDKTNNLIQRINNAMSNYLDNLYNKVHILESKIEQKNPVNFVNLNHQRLESIIIRINNAISNKIYNAKNTLSNYYDYLNDHVLSCIQYNTNKYNKVYSNYINASHKYQLNIESNKGKLSYTINEINNKMESIINNQINSISHISEVMTISNPFKQLQKGYSIVKNKDSNNIKSYKQIKKNQIVYIQLSDANLEAQVINITKNK